jgi:hypothetical protein
MSRFCALVLLALFLGIVVAALGAALLGGPAGPAPGSWDWPRLLEQLCHECQTREELLRRHERIGSNVSQRRRVIADLTAERITLVEAIARFRELNAMYPGIAGVVSPGECEEERLGRDVIERMCSAMRARPPAEVARIRARREAELAASLTEERMFHRVH